MKPPRILVIAGSDSGGGAGIQADIKTITMLGGFAMTAITAITAQNTQGVFGIHPVPLPMIRQQMECVLDDIGADIIKIGMLGTADITHTVADVLDAYPSIPIVLDPVMQAKGGAALLEAEALHALITRLIPKAALVTPNIPEAVALAGMEIATIGDMTIAARHILQQGARAVLIKGGHLESGEIIHNVLCTEHGVEPFDTPRINSPHTHGTGCTLASAIATYLALGVALSDAIRHANAYVHGAILNAPGYGTGHGPMHHRWHLI
jgi:hydroxymethylpyrimidine/phosphomethylpyrimidine kinase